MEEPLTLVVARASNSTIDPWLEPEGPGILEAFGRTTHSVKASVEFGAIMGSKTGMKKKSINRRKTEEGLNQSRQ